MRETAQTQRVGGEGPPARQKPNSCTLAKRFGEQRISHHGRKRTAFSSRTELQICCIQAYVVELIASAGKPQVMWIVSRDFSRLQRNASFRLAFSVSIIQYFFLTVPFRSKKERPLEVCRWGGCWCCSTRAREWGLQPPSFGCPHGRYL